MLFSLSDCTCIRLRNPPRISANAEVSVETDLPNIALSKKEQRRFRY